MERISPASLSCIAAPSRTSASIAADLLASKWPSYDSKETNFNSIQRSPVYGMWVDGEIDILCRKGLLDRALSCLSQLVDPPSHDAYVTLLRACAKLKNAERARCVHAHLSLHCIHPHGTLGEHLVAALAKCGAFDDAIWALRRLTFRTAFSWNAMISYLVDNGCSRDALAMHQKMLEDGVQPTGHTFGNLFRACGKIPDLEQGRKLHAEARQNGFCSDTFISNILVMMYTKCGSISEAEEVFGGLCNRDSVSWNSMLSSYVHDRQAEKALLLFRQMREENVTASQQSLVMALQACGMLADMDEGNIVKWISSKNKYLDIIRGLHVDARRNGFASHLIVGTTLLTMYGKCGAIREAEYVCASLCASDIISLTAMLSAYGHQNQGEKALQLYRKMLAEGINPDSKAFSVALHACGSLSAKEDNSRIDGIDNRIISFELVQALHADARTVGYASDVVLGSMLVNIYGKCGNIELTEQVFCALAHRDFMTWTSMMSVYVDRGHGKKALLLYRQMQEEGVKPDHQTIATALQACCIIADIEESKNVGFTSMKVNCLNLAKALHADSRKKGFAMDSFVCNALISLYGKCGARLEAEDVFSAVVQPDATLWAKMLLAYLELGQAKHALQFFKFLQEKGLDPNPHIFLIAVQACSILAQKEDAVFWEGRSVKAMGLEIGRALLSDAQKNNLHEDVYIATALVNLVGKSGGIEDAEIVCSGLSEPDIVLFTALLSVYVEQDQEEKALELYKKMQNDGIFILDDIILVCVLQASTKAGNMDFSRQTHFTIVSSSHNLTCYLASALAYAYGNSACSLDVQEILDGLIELDLVTWNACIASYAGEGNFTASVKMTQEMQLLGMKPDEVTFVSLLSACSHAGLVYQGLEFFELMSKEFLVTPDVKHYGTILDLLGRAGDFVKLKCIVKALPSQVDLATWLCLLGVCRIHGNLELAKQAFDAAVRLQPKEAAPYILMSKMYIDAGLNHLAEEIDKIRQNGCNDTSWLELG